MEIGLATWTGGYLTGESYGGGVHVLGSSLGRRQRWWLEPWPEPSGSPSGSVSLVGARGRRLVAEADGAVRCGGSGPGDRRARFQLELHPSGAWSLRQPESQRYLESDGEDVFCVGRAPRAPRHLWVPRLAAHAHAALFHPGRGRFARADPQLGRVWVDAPVPWPRGCGFVLRGPGGPGEEEEEEVGREGARGLGGGWFHLETAGGRFLSAAERLAARPSAQTALQLTLRPDGSACLADRHGRLLCPQGRRGLLRPAERPPSHGHEWFVVQRCPAWVRLQSRAGRFLGLLGDSEVYAGSKEATPMSCFLLEVGPDGQTVQLRGIRHKYLAQRPPERVTADGHPREAETQFRALWRRGRLFLRARNGRYLGTGPSGLVVARALQPGPSEEFGVRLANRSFLVLRGQYGYVGSGGPSGQPALVQGDRLQPDCLELLPCKRGRYHLRSRGKSFWSLTPERTFQTWGKFALNFCLEIRGSNQLAILAPNGYYVRGDREGPLVADSQEPTRECLWEF